MSSRQRKRPGGAVDSRPARKRSRLLPSSAGETSQTEPRDLEQSGPPTSEPEVIDLTGESSEPEVIVFSDDESAVDWEQSQQQQQQHLFRASENSAEPVARNDEEEPRDDDGDWLLFDFDPPYWSDENSEDRAQNQPQSHLSRSAENSAESVARNDEEEPRDDDGDWLLFDFDPPYWSDEDSEDRAQNQPQSHLSRSAENSAESVARNDEEEPRDNDGSINSSEWADRFESPPTWRDDITDDWEESQQYPTCSRSAEISLELLASNLQQEPRDAEFEVPGHLIPPNWEDDNAQLPQVAVSGQERRNVTLNNQEQVNVPGNGAGANDAAVADAAPSEPGSEGENTQSSGAEPGVIIRCPICMDFYSQIVQSGRQLVTTMCGHVFCSECLPVALETSPMCPTCRMEHDPELYFPIYL